MKLHELVDAVTDENSFLAFVKALRKDRELAAAAEKVSELEMFAPAQRGWENSTIESFLGAACSWAEDTRFGATQDLESASSWRKFAVFLYCGKIYE